MPKAAVAVREHDGSVELSITIDNEEPTIIVLDPQTARTIGDSMFKAGCSCGF